MLWYGAPACAGAMMGFAMLSRAPTPAPVHAAGLAISTGMLRVVRAW